ncbi:MAG: hypothetical protein RMI89_00500 [Gloeomargarita sp. SKYBB_i_bin120]|nr:hypothetical protein [Gloeomargarita sp. SKYG98]MCS7291441.1 hypothetical protein [Gloeomargarita sp. SKYB120]MDW8177001.1 hypothetical protein [Gloeomargarita sp. SKYBB_i_bin120]
MATVAPETDADVAGLVLLAVQGAEYWAVRRGAPSAWPVIPVPLGAQELADWWTHYQNHLVGRPAVLLGLAGALQPAWRVGAAVVYQGCTAYPSGAWRACDPQLTQWLAQRLALPLVQGLTTPRVVTQPADKQRLGEQFACGVVDMEGYVLLERLPRLGMVRVVSDGMHQPLPDLNRAIQAGRVQPLLLAKVLLQRPGAAWALVRHSQQALAVLTHLTQRLTGNAEKKLE